MEDHIKNANNNTEETNMKHEEKTKISCEVPSWLIEKIDEASRKHAECGRALIVRMALYSFFGIKD